MLNSTEFGSTVKKIDGHFRGNISNLTLPKSERALNFLLNSKNIDISPLIYLFLHYNELPRYVMTNGDISVGRHNK